MLDNLCESDVVVVTDLTRISRSTQDLYSNGITGGVGNNNFNPAGTVTSEQLAVFLYRTIPLSIKELRDNAK